MIDFEHFEGTTLEKVIAAGDALARSIGHAPGCPKTAQSIPCTCHSKVEQALALDQWLNLKKFLTNADDIGSMRT